MEKVDLDLNLLESIRTRAKDIHYSVNQFYDDTLPYSFHLSMVAEFMMKYVDYFSLSKEKIYALYFAAYFHDSIEDARLTYNDVLKIAKEYLDEENSLLATEIVYALTNEKGRNRAERANEKYYEGIRTTPYAGFIKVCDRLANTSYSVKICRDSRMHMVYKKELDHFIESLTKNVSEFEYTIPDGLLDELKRVTNLERFD